MFGTVTMFAPDVSQFNIVTTGTYLQATGAIPSGYIPSGSYSLQYIVLASIAASQTISQDT